MLQLTGISSVSSGGWEGFIRVTLKLFQDEAPRTSPEGMVLPSISSYVTLGFPHKRSQNQGLLFIDDTCTGATACGEQHRLVS